MKKLKSKFTFISVAFVIIALSIGSYFWLIQKQTKDFTGVREKVTICYGERSAVSNQPEPESWQKMTQM